MIVIELYEEDIKKACAEYISRLLTTTAGLEVLPAHIDMDEDADRGAFMRWTSQPRAEET